MKQITGEGFLGTERLIAMRALELGKRLGVKSDRVHCCQWFIDSDSHIYSRSVNKFKSVM